MTSSASASCARAPTSRRSSRPWRRFGRLPGSQREVADIHTYTCTLSISLCLYYKYVCTYLYKCRYIYACLKSHAMICGTSFARGGLGPSVGVAVLWLSSEPVEHEDEDSRNKDICQALSVADPKNPEVCAYICT